MAIRCIVEWVFAAGMKSRFVVLDLVADGSQIYGFGALNVRQSCLLDALICPDSNAEHAKH